MLLRVRRWIALRDVPHLAADTAEGRRVQMTGIVEVIGEPLIAPLTGQPCVASDTRYRAGGGNQRNVKTPVSSLVVDRQIQPFVIVRGAQRIVVDGAAAEILVPKSKLTSTQRQFSFLAQHGLHHTWGTLSERSVAPGQRVTVCGSLLRDGVEAAADLAFREARPVLKLVGSKAHPLVIAT